VGYYTLWLETQTQTHEERLMDKIRHDASRAKLLEIVLRNVLNVNILLFSPRG
jgi:hypothetical protein